MTIGQNPDSKDYSKFPPTRKEAQSTGAKHYFTGEPCKRGHITKRMTSNTQCYECGLIIREKNRDYYLNQNKVWRAKVNTHVVEYRKKYREENREAIAVYQKQYDSKYRVKNKALFDKRSKERQRAIVRQTPNNADMKRIAHICETCVKLSFVFGVALEVDHIIPISKGGLHHEDNLQILPARLNRQKSAKLDWIHPFDGDPQDLTNDELILWLIDCPELTEEAA